MKICRIGINETDLEMTDEELIELAGMIERAIDSLEEYNDLQSLKVHDKSFYEDIAATMKELANYE